MSKKYTGIIIIFLVVIIIILGWLWINKNEDTNRLEENESANKVQVEQRIEIPQSWNDEGVFSAFYDKAYEKLQTLTLEEKVGQLLLARVPVNNQIQDIYDYKLGGYILFAVDTKNQTKESLREKIQSYQNATNIPMIIATDEEGGTVVRVSSNPELRDSRFLSPSQLYKKGGLDLIRETTLEMSELLYSVGINTNLAPVATSKKGNVSYVLKHFPGYGNNKDTHIGISLDNRTLQEFEEKDFIPFKAGIEEGAEAILVSHNIITQVDKNNPASLSSAIHEIIRNNLMFTGVIITDDLAMEAIKEYTSGSPAVNAILAGNDMIIITDYKTAYNDIINSIEKGKILESQVDQKVFKILAWKYYKGLIK